MPDLGRSLATLALRAGYVLFTAVTATAAFHASVAVAASMPVARFLGWLALCSGLIAGCYWAARRSPRALLVVAIVVSTVLRLAWSLGMHVAPFADFEEYWMETLRLPDDPWRVWLLQDSKSPVAVLYYCAATLVLGKQLLAVYVVNALAAAAQVFLVFRIGRELRLSEAHAAFVAAVFALLPALIFFNGNVSSETPFVLLVLAALYYFLRFANAETPAAGRDIALCGALLGLGHLTRNAGVILCIAYLLGAALHMARRGAGLAATAKALLAGGLPFLLAVSPKIAANLYETGTVSISTTPFAAHNLLTGTNREHQGQWNQEDLIASGLVGNDRLPFYESRAIARRMAFERIASDPFGFVVFAFRDKLDVLFQKSEWSLYESLPAGYAQAEPARYALLAGLANTYYLMLLVLSTLAQIVALRRGDERLILLLAPFSSLGALHLVLQVLPRYQHPFLPLFVLGLAGLFAAKLTKENA